MARASALAEPALAPLHTSGPVTLMVGTEKGCFFLVSDADRSSWKVARVTHFGQVVNHVVADPRNPRKLVMGGRTGHMGPTMFHSSDGGKNWTESTKPPAFNPPKRKKDKLRAVKANFWVAPGHADRPGTWYLGTIPLGLFVSHDDGATWEGVAGFNENPLFLKLDADEPPGGPFTHSILIDPRDADHFYVSMSVGGTFETHDAGATWSPLNKGVEVLFGPEKYPEYGQDPHCVAMSPADPDRLYQQNHCGIYMIDRAKGAWTRVGLNMPKAVGDIGFAVQPHPRDPDTAWVFPMDGTQVWPRTSPGGKAAAFITKNGGKTWKRQGNGLPQSHGYLTVYRQALSADAHDKVGVYFGTTSGEVWASTDEGASWECVARSLPRILSVEATAKRDV